MLGCEPRDQGSIPATHPIIMPYKDKKFRQSWYRSRIVERRKFVENYKLIKGCADCGYNAHHIALQLDHIPGVRYHPKTIGAVKGSSLATLQKYLDKLDVVCANCHAIRSFARGQFNHK